MRLGEAIEGAINSAGVKGYITDLHVDTYERTVTVYRTVQGSDGKPVLFMNEDGTVDSFAVVAEEFYL